MTKTLGAGDFDGDRKNDLLTVDTAGNLWLLRGDGAAGWIGVKTKVGTGWGKYPTVVAPGDFSGDGFADVLAVDAAGKMWLYRGNGGGGWLPPEMLIGTGWQTKTAIVAAGDFNGDGFADIIARESTGELWLYPGNGASGWLGRQRIGTGWNTRTAIVGAGDFSGDGYPDLLARDANAVLWLYRGNGAGGWLTSLQVGSGWQGRTLVP